MTGVMQGAAQRLGAAPNNDVQTIFLIKACASLLPDTAATASTVL